MSFAFNHFNFNVQDLDRSIRFYQEVLGLHEVRRSVYDHAIYVFLGDDSTGFTLELTWLKDHPQAYDLGERDFHHLAMSTPDYEGSYDKLAAMGLIYSGDKTTTEFMITDPDGYIIEIIHEKK